MNDQKKMFLCSFCGKEISTNKVNLIRHEHSHKIEIRKIKCGACDSTFKQKSDYYRHWSKKQGDLKTIPDELDYVTKIK